ncbi:MAG: RNA polymerase sigma factor [Flavobacteriales bacterium]
MILVQKNNHQAFGVLYDRYNKRLLHFMFKMLNNDDEKAQDLLQDLFLKIAERPHLFDTTKKFYTWVFTVAANMCRTTYRNKEMQSTSNNESKVYHVSQHDDELIGRIDAGVFSTHLGRALDNLSYEHKETFVFRFQEDFSLKEIAEVMNCSEGTVKSRIFYTTKKLAEELKEFKPLLKK